MAFGEALFGAGVVGVILTVLFFVLMPVWFLIALWRIGTKVDRLADVVAGGGRGLTSSASPRREPTESYTAPSATGPRPGGRIPNGPLMLVGLVLLSLGILLGLSDGFGLVTLAMVLGGALSLVLALVAGRDKTA